MRIKYLFYLLIIFSPYINVTSQTLDIIVNNKNYTEILNTLYKGSDPIEKLNNSTIDQAKILAKITYEAYEDDPIKVYKFISSKNEEWNNTVKYDKSKSNLPRVSEIQSKIWEIIELQLSKKIYELIRIPYFIKGTVVSKDTSIFIDPSTNFDYRKVKIKIKIEDVTKGKNRFKEGEMIEFYYLLNWEKPKREFIVSKSYFLPLEPRPGIDNKYENIALVTYMDSPDAVFEIQSGVLIDETDYFNFGEKNSWKIFKTKFNEFVCSIKGGK